MKTKMLPVFAVVALLLATASIVRTQPQTPVNPPPAAPPHSDFTRRVAAVGLVEPQSENISIASHLPGVVEQVYVTAGQQVKAGDPLVRLDTRALEAARAERQSDVATREAEVATANARAGIARAQLADARRNLAFAESVTDSRSISAEELSRRRSAVETLTAQVDAAEAEIPAAQAAVAAARAGLKSVETDLERSTVTAPRDGRVLQLKIRRGEYVPAGPSATPWLVFGDVSELRVRADIDEHEAWRIRPESRAVAEARGNSNLRASLSFVRIEPLVVPKQSLTGAGTERVDTRVLQVIYKVDHSDLPLYVGQQMDVFIDAADADGTLAAK